MKKAWQKHNQQLQESLILFCDDCGSAQKSKGFYNHKSQYVLQHWDKAIGEIVLL